MRDQYLAPCLLAPFAGDMAYRLSRTSLAPLLETSADTGVLTQAMAAAASAGLTIVSTDPSDEMIAYASSKLGMGRITWQQADPLALPFGDSLFGIVTCHFGIGALSDHVLAFKEARRVIKKHGRLVFSVPGHLRHNPVADCLQDALDEVFPGDPPRFLEHVFHGYADNDVVDNDLTEAGFTDATYSTVDMPFEAASALDVAKGYCLGTPLRAEIEVRAPGDSDRVIQAVKAALETRFGSDRIVATMRAYFISASG